MSTLSMQRSGRCWEKRSAENVPAFTLIERLVVISVIAILAALLLPGLSRARDTALRVRCGSNLHQISLSLRLYLDDFQKFPRYLALEDYPAGFESDFRALYWDAKLLPYASRNQGVFYCPANTMASSYDLRNRPVAFGNDI